MLQPGHIPGALASTSFSLPQSRTYAEIHPPLPGRTLLFLTPFCLSQSLGTHGIRGYFADGRIWSADGADHWSLHEVCNWSYVTTALH